MDLEIYCLKCRNFTYRNNYNPKQGENDAESELYNMREEE